MTEPTFDADDEALLDQAVRGLRDDLPDDDRARRLDRIVTDYLEANPDPPRHRRRWGFGLAGGAAIAIAAAAFFADRRETPSPSSHAQAPTIAPSTESPGSSRSEPASTPVVSVDALPTAERGPAATSVKAPKAAEAQKRRSAADAPEEPGDELALLEEARAALASDPTRTLALADAHAKRFHAPLLAQERERLAIDALVRLGRREGAETRAKAFEATFPDSAHVERVRALVAPKFAPEIAP